jgi:peptidyl-prolyl cis-trans isomerase A (cyclophilin A)
MAIMHLRTLFPFSLVPAFLLACQSAPAELVSTEPAPPAAKAAAERMAGERDAAPKPAPAPVPTAPPSQDPLKGQFTLADATKDLKGKGALVADIDTDLGKLSCELYEDKAPITVANFVGLARGLRPFKSPSGEWVSKRAYDGTTFHRVIKGFMIQGGDPAGSGKGEPGYVIPDELWGGKHDRRGLLCMANRGPNTNGMQFFITDASAPHLDRSYTIFGSCTPDTVLDQLASVEVRGERPAKPPTIKTVTIRRSGKPPTAPKVAGSAAPAAPVAPKPAGSVTR